MQNEPLQPIVAWWIQPNGDGDGPPPAGKQRFGRRALTDRQKTGVKERQILALTQFCCRSGVMRHNEPSLEQVRLAQPYI